MHEKNITYASGNFLTSARELQHRCDLA